MPGRAPAGARRSASSQARAASAGQVSLARALSKLGHCSRKQAQRLIAAGEVSVGGRPVANPSQRVSLDKDVIRVSGRLVREPETRVAIALNKPVGYITSRTDPSGRPTVYALLAGLDEWVFPVGRLDRDSSGLLILTNDHRLGHALTDPAHRVAKTYHARVRGVPTEAVLAALREGVPLPDGTTQPAQARCLGVSRDGSAWIEIALTEGRNRQVRRMCSAIGHDVLDLTRVRIGCFDAPDLRPGQWRRLRAEEIAALLGTDAAQGRDVARRRKMESGGGGGAVKRQRAAGPSRRLGRRARRR